MPRKSSKSTGNKRSGSIWISILKWIGFLLTAATLLYYVLILAVPYIHPSKIRLISWVGLTMPFAVLAMFGWLVLWILTRQRTAWILLAIVMLFSFPIWRRTIVVNMGGDYPSKEEIASGHQLRIMTYNIEMFRHYEQDDSIVNLIEEGNYDIVCMQEYGHLKAKSQQWNKISARLNSIFPYRHIWFKNQTSRNENGLVLYSRYPIVKKVKINYDSKYNISVYSDIVVGEDTIRVFNNHLESNRLTKNDRGVAGKITDEYVDNESLYRSFREVLRKVADASILRASQADSVAAIIEQTPYPVIVLGDFNDVPQAYVYNRLIRSKHLNSSSSLTDAYASAGDWFYYYTFNQDHLNVPIDHILISSEFAVQDCIILPLSYSDHYPISTTLLLKP